MGKNKGDKKREGERKYYAAKSHRLSLKMQTSFLVYAEIMQKELLN